MAEPAKLRLAASGTVTIEAALLGVPMVTFYRVNALSWMLGRWMVRAPFLSMVNLIAGRQVAPELIQGDMTAERIASEAIQLLESEERLRKLAAERSDWYRRWFGQSPLDRLLHAVSGVDVTVVDTT